LSHDYFSAVRLAVAGNPVCPPGTLRQLAQDRSPEVARVAVHNPGAPSAVLAMWQLAYGEL
jgi:hypothetical protein